MFTSKLFEICQHWGMPPALIERNNCGAQVVDQFVNTLGYPNVVTYASKAGNLVNPDGDLTRPGVLAHTNTKYRGVMNMRYWLNELRAITIKDIRTLKELKTFVRMPNGTWGHKDGINIWDDRVMSLIWGLMILEPQITEKYFEVLDYDDYQKPKSIIAMPDYYGEKQFVNPISEKVNEKNIDRYDNIMPMVINNKHVSGNPDQEDIADLMNRGWKFMDRI